MLLAGGCWDYMDVNERSLAVGLGVDAGPDGAHDITLEVAVPGGAPAAAVTRPKGGGGGGAAASRLVLERTAETTPRALNAMRGAWPRPFTFGQLRLVVFGADYARRGEEDEFGCAACHPEISIGMRAAVADGRASDILRTEPPVESLTSIFIETMTRNARDMGVIPQTRTIGGFVADMEERDVALLPRVIRSDSGVELSGAAVFKDFKLAGFLDGDTTRGLNLLRGRSSRLLLAFPCPHAEEEPVSFGLTSLKSGINVLGEGTPLHVRYEVRIEGVSMDPGCPATGKERERALEEAAARAARDLALRAVRRAREMNVDFLGLEEYLMRRKPGLWKGLDWAKEFPRARIDVAVKVRSERHAR